MIMPTQLTKIQDFFQELLIDFNSKDTIPYRVNEDNWRQAANLIATSPTFAKNNIPTTENFPNWQKWGIIVYETMAK